MRRRLSDLQSPQIRRSADESIGHIVQDHSAIDGSGARREPEIEILRPVQLLNRLQIGLSVLVVGGKGAFVWGFVVSTVLLYHCVFSINSLAHLVGTRRFDTPDDSRNNWILALATFGEGWHNNHHFSMASCRHGLQWWEIDLTYAILKLLSFVGVVRGLRPFPRLGAKRVVGYR